MKPSSSGIENLSKALDLMGDTPESLAKALTATSAFLKSGSGLTFAAAVSALRTIDLNNPIQLQITRAIIKWAYVERDEWTGRTNRCTEERRDLIYERLGLPVAARQLCNEHFPPIAADEPLVISDTHEEWYGAEPTSSFYWKAYSRYLAEASGWKQENINVLDTSTTAIVERLSCPWRSEVYQSKGLVVGYVQSGKTANFTGVLAKAVDAGYRLIIVLSGLLDVLRNQTQRRIDRELVGKELLELAPDGNEYAADQDWASFIEHGGLPSRRGGVDWLRFTGRDHDYEKLGKGVDALELEHVDPHQPLFVRENLGEARARLLVVKKNPIILRRILADLKSLHRTNLNSIPALIIDDESDQASIDTSRIDHEATRRRTATNKAIVDLLKMLPRAQYVGYTATPFANVFVDPEDSADIFPRDFIVSLPRPNGYMGVSDFFDVDDLGDEATFASSNEKAYVRPVLGLNDSPENLPAAIESFLLAGAVKLFRHSVDQSLVFRHHTMLVHSSAFKRVHRGDADFVARQYEEVTRDAQVMWRRLGDRFNKDVVPVSAVRGRGLPLPTDFTQLRPFVLECKRRLEERSLIRIVNGDNKDDPPDFDMSSVWSILVGGTKLSRGYTIEGLTVSYYRRTSSTADTLMQMGRWFGFRKGYGDLVRLYLGTNEPLDKKGRRTLNLLEAFKGTCLDEEEFRNEIKRYVASPDGTRLRPIDLPPLVPSHMLRPTQPNKMRYAKLKMVNFGGRNSEKTLAPDNPRDIGANSKTAQALVESAHPRRVALEAVVDGKRRGFTAIVGSATPTEVLRFLKNYVWAPNTLAVIQREIDFLEMSPKAGDPGIDTWLIIAPQLKSADGLKWTAAGLDFSVKGRSRINEAGRFKAFSEPDHRAIASYLCGIEEGTTSSRATLDLKRDRQGALLLYPVVPERTKEQTSIGFALFFPKNQIRAQLRWGVGEVNA